jgi:FkbM family methyltransferase
MSKSIEESLADIQSKLTLRHGSFMQEYPEQKMAVKYLTGNEKVLEIGGNIGRNSLVISYILAKNNNYDNLLVLECDPVSSRKLDENRIINGARFQIENAALSNRKLIQKGWDTIVSDTVLEGYVEVNTITYNELNEKYNIAFDTLVLDCEGAFYYILKDNPEILNNIKKIIMENDYQDLEHKKYIDSVLKQNNFNCIYTEGGGWGPCADNFYEFWERI